MIFSSNLSASTMQSLRVSLDIFQLIVWKYLEFNFFHSAIICLLTRPNKQFRTFTIVIFDKIKKRNTFKKEIYLYSIFTFSRRHRTGGLLYILVTETYRETADQLCVQCWCVHIFLFMIDNNNV